MVGPCAPNLEPVILLLISPDAALVYINGLNPARARWDNSLNAVVGTAGAVSVAIVLCVSEYLAGVEPRE